MLQRGNVAWTLQRPILHMDQIRTDEGRKPLDDRVGHEMRFVPPLIRDAGASLIAFPRWSVGTIKLCNTFPTL